MDSFIKCPTKNKAARSSKKECFTSACCSEGTVSSAGHEVFKENRQSMETETLEKESMQQLDARLKKSNSLKRKNDAEITSKISPKSSKNCIDASKSVSKTVDWMTGGLSDVGKIVGGKASKKKPKIIEEVENAELQISFHEENMSLAEGSIAVNHRNIDGRKKGGRKNLHLQRRILANARERSRVHKLGEAFRMLRNAIPSFSMDQKLSKLSTLRIAVSYISALASLLDLDKEPGAKQVFTSSVDQCTFALQSEFGRAKGARNYKAKVGKTNKCKKTKYNK